MTGATVRWVRQGLNLSQEAFAAKLHVSRRTIIRWEQDEHLPPTWHHKKNGRQNRRRFFELWTKYERWLNRGHLH